MDLREVFRVAVMSALAGGLWPGAGRGDAPVTAAQGEGVLSVRPFGARGDGVADDTAAIQSAIDKAAEKGGQVYLPPGRYLVKGSLQLKPGVAVMGAAVAPLHIKPLIGTVVLATGGRDNEQAPALFELGDSAAVQGLTVQYPEQRPDDIHPYAWTFHLRGGDNTVENVTLINSYNGIRIGPEPNVRHRVRSVFGCVLRRGIVVDGCTDVGRIENVHFHCHWWSATETGGEWGPVHRYMWQNLEAFTFGYSDWEYVTNCFVYPARIGYRFVRSEGGACNGQFSGNGSDESQVCVQVDAIQPMGLQITNGEFVASMGDDPTGVVIGETCEGQVRLVNCNFWGAFRRIAVLKGPSFCDFSDCHFSYWDCRGEDLPAIDMQAGRLQVRGCTFRGRSPAVRIGKKAGHAIITGNNGEGMRHIEDRSGGRAIIRDNEPPPPAAWPWPRHPMISSMGGAILGVFALVFLVQFIVHRNGAKSYLRHGISLGAVTLVLFVPSNTVILWPGSATQGFGLDLAVSATVVFLGTVLFACMGMFYCSDIGTPDAPLTRRMWGTPCTGGGTISWSYLPAVIAVVVCALVYSKMLASRAGAAPSSDQAEFLTDLVHNVLNIGRHAVPLVLFAQVFTGAFVEEVAFRLGVQNFFARQLHLRRWRYGAAIIGAAALWSLLHAGFVGPGYVKFIQLFPLGVALGFLFRRYGVESCILAHGTFDLAWLYWGLR